MPNSIINNVLEMFCSIQGEGRYIGIPSIFIRFAKCNLKCNYCDTVYSWDETGKYNVIDVIDYINENPEYYHVVITGGEPLLYQDDIIKIVSNFPNRVFTIESNGTLKPDARLVQLMSEGNFWSISPKLYRWKDSSLLKEICGWDAFLNCQFKFVVEDIEQLELIKFLITTRTITVPIIVQPDGMKEGNYNDFCQELANKVIAEKLTKLRVLPQFQKICWGRKRGV